MAKRIIIVGDLIVPYDGQERIRVLHLLAESQPAVDWEWVKCNSPAYNLPKKPFSQLLQVLRNPLPDTVITVVKLACLNGREKNQLHQACTDPILAPMGIATGDDLLNWLLDDKAAIVKNPPWVEPVRVAALLAILAKLIKNKSWNGSKQGHHWTQEADLLGQAPVYREGGILYSEAGPLLGRMEDVVLLCKGGKQGKTKKEWCICQEHVPAVKQAIKDRSVQPLRLSEPWSIVMGYADRGRPELVCVDNDIVNERVRYICRDLR